MDPEPEPIAPSLWLAAGVFRALLHQADFDAPPWQFAGRDIWFASCNCPVLRLPANTAASRHPCPDCARINTRRT